MRYTNGELRVPMRLVKGKTSTQYTTVMRLSLLKFWAWARRACQGPKWLLSAPNGLQIPLKQSWAFKRFCKVCQALRSCGKKVCVDLPVPG
jgi:hypothetical protein